MKTRHFGEIAVDEKLIFNFPDGIFGFDDIKKFVILDFEEEDSPFKWLQAFNEPELAFIIIMPNNFMAEYELVISQTDIEAVGAASIDDLIVFAIVTIPSNPDDMTANLQGPVIINPGNNTGKQVISLSDKYGVRHKILDEIKKISGEG